MLKITGYRNLFISLLSLILLGACGPKSKLLFEGLSEDLQIKRITPKMKIRMAELEAAGCEDKFEVKDPGMAKTLAVFPGGGQLYNEEPLKAIYYMGTSFFILPYIASFKDAKQTREYLNFESSIQYCEEQLRVLKERENLPAHILLKEKTKKAGSLWSSNPENAYYRAPQISIDGIGKNSYRKMELK
jgi:hypothetical protein